MVHRLQTNRIGRIAAAGEISFFESDLIDGPSDIISGSDGALWFTNIRDSSLGRITVAGAVTRIPLSSGERHMAVTAGADGAIWVVADFLYRVTTDGDVQSFAGDRLSGYQVAAGPDGTIWLSIRNDAVLIKVALDAMPIVISAPAIGSRDRRRTRRANVDHTT